MITIPRTALVEAIPNFLWSALPNPNLFTHSKVIVRYVFEPHPSVESLAHAQIHNALFEKRKIEDAGYEWVYKGSVDNNYEAFRI